jgi:hypothetical protein
MGIVAAVALVAYLGLQPLARYLTRDALGKLDGYRAEFADAGVSIIPLHYWIGGLKIWEAPKSKAKVDKPPILALRHLEAGFSWRKLWHRQLLLSVWADEVSLHLVETPAERNPAKQALPLADQLRALVPLEMDRGEIKRSEAVYVFGADRHVPSIRLTEIEATLENLVTRADLEEGTATLAYASKVQDTGNLTAFVTADPLEKKLTFAGEARLEKLPIAELAPVVEAKIDLRPTRGTLDVLARFESKGGRLSGGIKPILRNAHVEPTDANLVSQIKASLVDASLKILSDRVPNRNAIATVIPIEGTLDKPDIQLWPTVLGVVRNAFVEGFSETYRMLPPPEEKAKPALLSQISSALSKRSPPPKANPAPAN